MLFLVLGIVALAASTISAAVVPPAPSPAPRRALSIRDILLQKRQNLPHLPDCVTACIEQSAESVGCNEYNCLCHSSGFINSTAFCLAATCSDSAALYGVQFGQQIGVTESIPDAANSVLATKTTAGTSGAFDAVSSTASAVTAASAGTSPYSSPSPSAAPSNSGSWRLVPGVDAFGGAIFVTFGLGISLLL